MMRLYRDTTDRAVLLLGALLDMHSLRLQAVVKGTQAQDSTRSGATTKHQDPFQFLERTYQC